VSLAEHPHGVLEGQGVLPMATPPRTPEAILADVLTAYRRHHPRSPVQRIQAAFDLAADAHRGQTRKSGEPYVTHPTEVSLVLAELGLDDTTIAAGLLHDSVEDTGITLEDLDSRFGPELAAIVDGVTKLDRLEFDSKEAQQAATMRKMLVAMARDLRVLLIKLADRLHNMRTIDALPEWKQRRTAQETLDIYAPLAHRLGIGEIKHELEDHCFRVLEPRKHAEIRAMVETRSPERERYLSMAIEEVRARLAELRIEAEVRGRPKHMWSIYEKMVVKGKSFEEIHDLIGIRVIVDSVKDCYAALGSIHATWKPVQGRFKDYIAMPKFNLYQSLHTTVVGPEGKVLECQVRTREMHQRAEFGIAAHFSYKESHQRKGRHSGPDPTDIDWVQRIADAAQSDQSEPSAFLEALKIDLDQDEAFVFTPKGKVVTLPSGATPIDFAYAIHTDVGHRCIGARVNGRLMPLDTRLNSGETVEIITSKVDSAQPSRDWLAIVETPRARAKIKAWFSKERREDALETGRDELTRLMRREGLPVQKLQGSPVLESVAQSFGYQTTDQLLVAIGEGHLNAPGVVQRVARQLRGGEQEEQLPTLVRKASPAQRARRGQGVGVHVEGLDDVMVRLSRCCTPVPGDEIVGFVTRGRGVAVHRSDCTNSQSLRRGQGARMIEVEWDRAEASASGQAFVVSLQVEAFDRARLLADVARVLSDNGVNVLACTTHTGSDRVARQKFDIELADPTHLDAILRAVRTVDSVFDVYRLLPGSKSKRD
jgi:guanosine-3',5'-bis(diphosphate) 3'-pyrophosphohydrolase